MLRQLPCIPVLLFATPAFGVIIDDFSVGDVTVEVDVSIGVRINSVIQTGLDTSAVIGGRRLIGRHLDPGQPGDVGVAIVDNAAQTLPMHTTTPDGFERYGVGWADLSDPGTALNVDLFADGLECLSLRRTVVRAVAILCLFIAGSQ